jgi:hypothetical protein
MGAFGGGEGVEELADGVPEDVDASDRGGSEQGLERGDGELDSDESILCRGHQSLDLEAVRPSFGPAFSRFVPFAGAILLACRVSA